MDIERNKALIRALYTRTLAQSGREGLEDLIAPDCRVRGSPAGPARGPEAWHAMAEGGRVVTALYQPEALAGRRVLAVLTFPPKKIGPFWSQVLLTGFAREDGAVVLAQPERRVPDGSRLV